MSKYLYCNTLAADSQAAGGSTQDQVTAAAKRFETGDIDEGDTFNTEDL
ncbi:MAG: hypothetical protein HC859_10190 [Bacteroidia bacterium]|nr:hypothetical protein [Bacteroidia bacterium]